jgi:hypothetical protein
MPHWPTYILVPVALAALAGCALAVGLHVGTEVPEYILDDHIELQGSTSGSTAVFLDLGESDLRLGTLENLTFSGGALTLTEGARRGVFTSRVRDAGTSVDCTAMELYADARDGSLCPYVRAAPSDGEWGPWHAAGPFISSLELEGRLIQYRVVLASDTVASAPELRGVAIRYLVPVVRVIYSFEGGPWQDADGTTSEWSLSLRLSDGDHRVEVRAVDALGYEAGKVIELRTDLLPPQGTVVVDGGASYTSSRALHLSLDAQDTHGVRWVKLAAGGGEGALDGTEWQPFGPQATLWYAGPDGDVAVRALLKDAAGRTGGPFEANINVTTADPVVWMAIENGTGWGHGPDVEVKLGWRLPFRATSVRASERLDFADATWLPRVTTLRWALPTEEASFTVYASFRDAEGALGFAEGTVALDLHDPQGGISLDGGAGITLDACVEVAAWANDTRGVAAVQLTESPVPGQEGGWAPLPAPTMLWLTDALGPHTVYLHVRDVSGRVVSLSDTIVYVPCLPSGTVTLADGRQCTSSCTVNLTVEVQGGGPVTAIRGAAEGEVLEGKPWLPIEGTSTWELPPGDGPKPMTFQLLGPYDVASWPIPVLITVDTTPPTVAIVHPAKKVVDSTQVDVIVSVEDASGTASVDIGIDGGEMRHLGSRPTLVYSGRFEPGDHTVLLRATDGAGNVQEASVAFKVEPPGKGGTCSSTLVLIGVLASLSLLVFFIVRRSVARALEDESTPVPQPSPPPTPVDRPVLVRTRVSMQTGLGDAGRGGSGGGHGGHGGHGGEGGGGGAPGSAGGGDDWAVVWTAPGERR